MNIRVSPKDGVPIYRQIMRQVKYLVASGRLEPGEELLPIRQLAKVLLINPNTVARAYRDLETEGIVVSKQGSGTIVNPNGSSPLAHDEKLRILTESADRLVSEASNLDIESDTLLEIIRHRFDALEQQGEES
ncbi:MAG: GntR family transcriptional regulator [Candidatus Hydrogenedentota bacterium]